MKKKRIGYLIVKYIDLVIERITCLKLFLRFTVFTFLLLIKLKQIRLTE
jgi:hypothetical protein